MRKTGKMIISAILLIALFMVQGESVWAVVIRHNVTALNAHRNLTDNSSMLTKNLEKLSSGYRINHRDDIPMRESGNDFTVYGDCVVALDDGGNTWFIPAKEGGSMDIAVNGSIYQFEKDEVIVNVSAQQPNYYRTLTLSDNSFVTTCDLEELPPFTGENVESQSDENITKMMLNALGYGDSDRRFYSPDDLEARKILADVCNEGPKTQTTAYEDFVEMQKENEKLREEWEKRLQNTQKPVYKSETNVVKNDSDSEESEPNPEPTPEPSPEPSPEPTPEPSPEPTPEQTPESTPGT